MATRSTRYLGAFHDHDNPVRLVTLDPDAGTIQTWIYSPRSGTTKYSLSETGVDFVR